MGSSRSSGSSSSGEEDGDAEWRAAIHSVAAATFNNNNNGSSPKPVSRRTGGNGNNPIDDKKAQQIKRSQLKAQKILDDILGKTIEIVRDPPIPESNSISEMDDGGVRLFRDAPVGIVFDHVDELQGPTKKPRILPGREYDEKLKKFKRQLDSVMVDGMDIITAARDASKKSLAKLEAREAAAKAAEKREEDRIATLKKLRGERWLPSIAGDMQIKIRNR